MKNKNKKIERVLGPEYMGITFEVGYNKSFADFKKEFGDMHVFNNLAGAEREKALKEAHKIATKDNGNTSTTGTKGQDAQ